MLLASSLLVTTVKDTVWWNTPGGQVLEHRDDTGANCSLMLYDDNGSVVFQWDGTSKTLVTAIDWRWQFPDNWALPVAVQLGDVWLSEGGNSVVIQAVGHGNAVSFSVNQSIDALLHPIDHILVRITNGQLLIALNPGKIITLLLHAKQCSDVIGR
jgi:hypothetical protein